MVLKAIVELIVDRTGCEKETVKPESTFEDLGIDSLDRVDLLMALEDEVGVKIDLSEKVETVAELAALVEKKKKEQEAEGV